MSSLVIAHRLTTVQNADVIMGMDKGRVVETGNHSELIQNHPDGIYAKLVKHQQND